VLKCINASILAFLFVCLSYPSCVDAGSHSYAENFGTKQYCDTLNTSAWWDTVAKELKLHPFRLNCKGSCNSFANANGVAISGDYAYVVDEDFGLRVVDISDPTSPALIATCNTPGASYGIAISGDYAYVADGSSGLQVISIVDPGAPTVVGSVDTPGGAYGVAISGDYACVADGSFGLHVIGVSNPASPTLMGSYDTPGSARGVVVSGDYAFVADYSFGFLVIDVSDPGLPADAGGCDTPGLACGLAVSGDYAYVADGSSGIQIIDISLPVAPHLVASYDTPGQACGIEISGMYVYVADGSSGLQVIDVSDAASPALTGNYDAADEVRGIAVSGQDAYVTGLSTGLQIIQVTEDLLPPMFAGSFNTSGSAYGVQVSGQYCYVADRGSGVQVINIANPRAPTRVGSINSPGDAYDVAIQGDYAYVAHGSSGLLVIDVSDPGHPAVAGRFDLPYECHAVAACGNLAYITGEVLFRVIDITDPTSPGALGVCNVRDEARSIVISGRYAYVAELSYGLQVIDISNSRNPTPVAVCCHPEGCAAKGVAISGDYAFLADGEYGMQVIDVTNPLRPGRVGHCDIPYSAERIAVSGDRAYVTDVLAGLQVIDISNPLYPSLIGSCDTPGLPTGVSVCGDYAYVADGGSGLRVIQVCQRDLSLKYNVGRSLVISELDGEIVRLRVVSSQTDSVCWHVSATGGVAWEPIVPDVAWHGLASPGPDLVWRSTHVCVRHDINPTCSSLQLAWLYDFAVIDSIVDVPDDEGGWVGIYFTRSGFDFADEADHRITEYQLFRQTDGPDLICLGRHPSLASTPLAPAEFPPGTWELVASLPANHGDQYFCSVPTVADSASAFVYSVYCILAKTSTPVDCYFSPPDSGYSVDNLPPSAPQGLAGRYGYPSFQFVLTWNPNMEADLSHYAVYKGDHEAFIPGENNCVATTTDTLFIDPYFDPHADSYYKVSAWDTHENESEFSLLLPGEITGAVVTLLEQNVPNPFNPLTAIRFSIAEPGWARLLVFDVGGRLVRTFLDGEVGTNKYEVVWDARDDAGKAVASGVYFCRLEAPGYIKSRKMMLLR